MSEDKIAAFYDDPVKTACDEFSVSKAYRLRSFSTDAALALACSPLDQVHRQYGVGAMRQIAGRFSAPPRDRAGRSVTSSVRP
jgi:hypothetical protein